MESYSAQQDLNELKLRFEKALGVIDYHFTNDQLLRIFQVIEEIPEGGRTLATWQAVVTEVTGFRKFRMFEALEFSDIDNLHKQIQEILKGKKK